jgi:TRAP-type C4-dicarboxylate transport system permease small subunit
MLERGNITLRILDSFLPLSIVRLVDLVVALLVLIVLFGMVWQFWLYGIKTMRGGEITWLLNIPKAPFWFVVAGILCLTAIIQVVLTLHAAGQLLRVRS